MTDAQSEDEKTEIGNNGNLLNLAIEEVSGRVSRARYDAMKQQSWVEETRKQYNDKLKDAERANEVLQREEFILNALLAKAANND